MTSEKPNIPSFLDIKRMLEYRCVTDCDLTKDAPIIWAYIERLEQIQLLTHQFCRDWGLSAPAVVRDDIVALDKKCRGIMS